MTEINTNKLHSLWEDMSLFKAEGQVLGLTDSELATHVVECNLQKFCPVEYVIDNDSSVGV